MSGAAGGGAGAVVRQGHLRKLKTMKKKFFVLRAETTDFSAKLEYYESEKKFKAGAAPRRVLPLKSCYNITRRLDLKQKHVIALFTREEQFCIVAENEPELHAWLTAILRQHRSDDGSDELLHPIQHVWQVNVQKKGLGSSKNIQGLYNLCLTDKTLTLVKIKSHNNVISDLGIPERVDYSLKNIRRCGDSECFFYMEVGRQTVTGAGELWMHTDDSNIAQSMHSTIYHAMRNCSKECENERDHIVMPSGDAPPTRRQTLDGSGRAGLTNDATTLRNRCDSMPSRACSSFEVERPPPRHNDLEGLEISRDEPDTVAEWYRTPRIPEEPDCCDISKDFMSTSIRGGGSIQHSRTSSLGIEDSLCADMLVPDGYLPMLPGHDPLGGLISASSGSVCSGTPSTDPRFSEYQLEPATSHIGLESRPPRAYSVGSRPAARGAPAGGAGDPTRHRAYSVGARHRPKPQGPRASADDLMELDFSINSPAALAAAAVAAKVIVAQTPPSAGFVEPRPKTNVDEYVDMSPRNGGYVEMRPGEPLPLPLPLALTPLPSTSASASASTSAPTPVATTPDGYVEMNYGRAATRPIAIAAARPPPPLASSPDDARKRRIREPKTPLGSQTLFPLSLDSPASPPEPDAEELEEDMPHHPLSTVREISEECGRRSPELARLLTEPSTSSSPQYVTLARISTRPIVAPLKTPEPKVDELSCNPTATKTIVRAGDTVESRLETISTATLVLAGGGAPARFSLGEEKRSPPPVAAMASVAATSPSPCASPSPCGAATPLNYAALDLEPRRAAATSTPRTYTQIDFMRSEKLHAADGT